MNRSKIAWMFPLLALLALGGACRPDEGEEMETGLDQETQVAPAPAPEPETMAMRSAAARFEPAPGSNVSGTVRFIEEDGGVRVVADLTGVESAGKHGFHIHENGQCEHDGDHFSSAGGHFNPTNAPHACPPTEPRHAGDLGNVEVGPDGAGRLEATTNLLSLEGPNSVVGKAVILHADEDDCQTQPTGNAGGRIACAVVTMEGEPMAGAGMEPMAEPMEDHGDHEEM